ncbi:hypothetical protein SBDP1_630004 [Syntrophobacter sp. SbD1]|nr:hypothetical protein SBDP1_630004 [Syntrophobacter sp. SbD1]
MLGAGATPEDKLFKGVLRSMRYLPDTLGICESELRSFNRENSDDT